jgi:hypothetical protein
MEMSVRPTAGEVPPCWHLESWGQYRIGKWPIKRHLRTIKPQSRGVFKVILIGCQAETVVGLHWAADSCPWVWKLRTVLPLSDVIRDQCGAVGVDSSTCAYLKW